MDDERESAHENRPACPRCGSINTVPIVYGLVMVDNAWAQGEYELGGCIVGDGQPDRFCRVCELEWPHDTEAHEMSRQSEL